MNIAVNKESPISAASIFWANFVLFFRVLCVGGGLLLIYGTFKDFDPSTFETKIYTPSDLLGAFSGILITMAGAYNFFGSYSKNIALRKLRYNGVLVLHKRTNPDYIGKWGLWVSTIPFWRFSNFLEKFDLDEFIHERIAQKAEEDDTYVQFIVARDTDGTLRAQLVHHCTDTLDCEKPEIHLFGYSEARNGPIWWG